MQHKFCCEKNNRQELENMTNEPNNTLHTLFTLHDGTNQYGKETN